MSETKPSPFLNIKLAGDFHKPPFIRENKNFPWIWAGKDNSYFEYLIACYQYSPTHSAIVNGKAKYIFGKGPEWNGAGKAKFDELAKRFRFKDLLFRIIRDYELFNGYYFKASINPLNNNLKTFEHLPFRAMRTNKYCDIFYHSNNWTKEQTIEPYFKRTVRPFDLVEYNKYHKPELYEQVWNNYHTDPGTKIYPLPPYMGGLAVVQTEVEINNFNLVSAKTMFSADIVVSIPEPTPENAADKAQYDNMFKNKFSGSDNAGEIVLYFTGGGENKLDIQRIAPSNLPDLYENLLPRVMQGIFTAHEVTSPMLFGIETPGKLGGRNEMIDAYELFENNYLASRRYEIESDLTAFFNSIGIEGELTFPPQPPLSLTFSEATIVDVLKASGGLNKAVGQYINDPVLEAKPDTVLSPAEPPQSPLEAALAKFDSIGEPGDKYRVIAAINCPRYKSEGEYEAFEGRIKALNFTSHKFAELTNLESELLGLLIADDEYTLDELAEKTGAKKNEVIAGLNRIQQLNMLQYTTDERAGKVTVKRDAVSVEPKKKYNVNIKYRYWGPRDERNRKFCAELLKKGKLYTYSELLAMKNPDGESFILHRGGWYHDPNTGVNRDNCRHILQAVIVETV